jgi:hypothetical protein
MTTPSGEASAITDECPINVRYVDSTLNVVDMDAIIRGGRRIRRRRTTTASIGALAIFATVAAVSLTVSHAFTNRSAVQTAGIYKSTTLRSFPPVDQVVALGTYPDAEPSNWSAIAWISQNGDFCHGAADMSPHPSDGSMSLSCGTAPAELTSRGPTEMIPGWPVFQAAPTKTGEFLAVGLLRGTAAKVEVTANGQTAEAAVYPLATATGEPAGAYAVWLRAEPDGSIHSSDITRIQALDTSGSVVAQIRTP